MELPGGTQIVSIITKVFAENLGLAVWKLTCAIIKASGMAAGVD